MVRVVVEVKGIWGGSENWVFVKGGIILQDIWERRIVGMPGHSPH